MGMFADLKIVSIKAHITFPILLWTKGETFEIVTVRTRELCNCRTTLKQSIRVFNVVSKEKDLPDRSIISTYAKWVL